MRPSDDLPGATAAPVRLYRYDAGAVGGVTMRALAEETPIEIAFGGVPFAVMMATPIDLEDFALGFAFTEGVVERFADIRAIEVRLGADSARVDVALTGERMGAHLAAKRALAGRSGCGVCGIEDLAHLPKTRPRVHPAPAIAPKAVGVALAALERAQPLNGATRAVHAAAWCGGDGAILVAREDVGRHNALDKVIGALMREKNANPDDGFLLITSRASFEMVAKAVRFGAGTLVSVSAPTSLAAKIAKESGVDLIAVARADSALAFGANYASEGAAA